MARAAGDLEHETRPRRSARDAASGWCCAAMARDGRHGIRKGAAGGRLRRCHARVEERRAHERSRSLQCQGGRKRPAAVDDSPLNAIWGGVVIIRGLRERSARAPCLEARRFVRLLRTSDYGVRLEPSTQACSDSSLRSESTTSSRNRECSQRAWRRSISSTLTRYRQLRISFGARSW